MKDPNQPHGELYLDTDGAPHFDCVTPARVDFYQTRNALLKYIGLLRKQIENQEMCPYSPERVKTGPPRPTEPAPTARYKIN